MQKISDVIKDLKISKEDFMNLVKEVSWKEYSTKTTKISDTIVKKVINHLSSWKKTKKVPIEKEEIIMWDEIEWDWWFLEWLWISFEDEEEVNILEEVVEKKESIKKKKKILKF